MKFQRFFVYLFLLLMLLQVTFADRTLSPITNLELKINQASYRNIKQPILQDANGVVLVPIRIIAEALDCKVGWDQANRIITIQNHNRFLALQLDNPTLFVDGQLMQMHTAPIYHSDYKTNYVPLRFLSTYLATEVSYSKGKGNGKVTISLSRQFPSSQMVQTGINRGNTGVERHLNPSGSVYSIEAISRSLNSTMPTLGTEMSIPSIFSQEAIRQDIDRFGYKQYVFENSDNMRYLSMVDNQIVRWRIFGTNWKHEAFQAGQTWEETLRSNQFLENQTFNLQNYKCTIKQSPSDRGSALLVIKDDYAYKLYFDAMNNRLLGLECLMLEDLLRSKAYGVKFTYSGKPPEIRVREFSKEEIVQMDLAVTQEIIELTNIYRRLQGLDPLQVCPQGSQMALNHTEDMVRSDFVAHISPNTGTLGQRYTAKGIDVLYLSENIAFGPIDGLDAVHAWIISDGHRANLLSNEAAYIGVGTYGRYYTQNFILYK